MLEQIYIETEPLGIEKKVRFTQREVKVKDGKGKETVFELNRPHMGIYLPQMVWKDMYDFSGDSVLLFLASEHYDAEEYIRNYDEFVRVIEKLRN